MNRRTLLRCLPATPIATAALLAAPTASAVQAALVEPAEVGIPTSPRIGDIEIGDIVDGREVLDVCEHCSRPLFQGDRVFSYSDGPTFCEADAPTWNDLKAMQDEDIADGTWSDHFEEPEEAQDAIDSVAANIAAGHGAEKCVWPL